MRKTKCDDCKTWHQGFHLCPGPDAPVELRKQDYVHVGSGLSKSASATRQWEAFHKTTQERDREIVQKYEAGMTFREIGEHFLLTKTTIRSIFIRMGGVPRSRAEQAGKRYGE